MVLALGIIQTGTAQLDRYTVAVLPFTVSDPTGRTPQALGETLPNYFEAPIFSSQKFVLIDKSITDKIMADIASSEAGLTSSTIKELGTRYNVDIFIAGTITVEGQTAPSLTQPQPTSTQPYIINARFIDTSIGEVRSVTQIRVSSDADFQTAAQYITNEGLTRFPLEGQIFAISGPDIYIDIGSIQGLSSQDRTGYVYRQVQIKDRSIREQIGTFTITTLYDDSSKIKVSMVIGYDPKEGDSVVIAPIAPGTESSTLSLPTTATTPTTTSESTTTMENDTSASSATTTLTPEPQTTSATGTLVVESDVPAEVYLDGEFMGVTPLTLETAPGDYTLELWSETYETLSQTITLTASETLTINETLEPVTATAATVMLSLTPPGTVVRIDGKLQLDRTFTLEPGDYTLELRHNGYETKTLPLTLTSGESINITEALTATTGSAETTTQASSTALSESTSATDDTTTAATSDSTVETTQTETTQTETTEAATTETTPTSIPEANADVFATLNLSVFPPDAAVTIDGSPSQAGILELSPGTKTLEVTLDGYEPFSTQLELEAGQTLPFDVTLGASLTETSTTTTKDTSATAGIASTSATESATETTSVSQTNADNYVNLSAGSCDDAASLKSGDFSNETQILFMNQSNNPIKTYWVNYGGGLEFYNDLLPGQEVLQQTALGHVWIVTDENNQCLAIFKPVAEPARAILE